MSSDMPPCSKALKCSVVFWASALMLSASALLVPVCDEMCCEKVSSLARISAKPSARVFLVSGSSTALVDVAGRNASPLFCSMRTLVATSCVISVIGSDGETYAVTSMVPPTFHFSDVLVQVPAVVHL